MDFDVRLQNNMSVKLRTSSITEQPVLYGLGVILAQSHSLSVSDSPRENGDGKRRDADVSYLRRSPK